MHEWKTVKNIEGFCIKIMFQAFLDFLFHSKETKTGNYRSGIVNKAYKR